MPFLSCNDGAETLHSTHHNQSLQTIKIHLRPVVEGEVGSWGRLGWEAGLDLTPALLVAHLDQVYGVISYFHLLFWSAT